MSADNIVEFPVPDDLVRRFGVSSKQLRAEIKPLILFMYEHGIPDLTIKRDGAKVEITIIGKKT